MSDIAPGFVPGIVVKNDDPEGGGRIKVKVPGLIEPYTPYWVMPGCWPGAVDSGKGSQYKPPAVNSHVFVIFEYGIYDRPDSRAIYLTGYYGLTATGQSASPATIQQATTVANGRTRTCLYEDDSIAMYIVDEPTVKRAVIQAKKSGSKIELNAADGESGKSETVYIEARTMISLYSKGAIDIRANIVQINGRRVAMDTGCI